MSIINPYRFASRVLNYEITESILDGLNLATHLTTYEPVPNPLDYDIINIRVSESVYIRGSVAQGSNGGPALTIGVGYKAGAEINIDNWGVIVGGGGSGGDAGTQETNGGAAIFWSSRGGSITNNYSSAEGYYSGLILGGGGGGEYGNAEDFFLSGPNYFGWYSGWADGGGGAGYGLAGTSNLNNSGVPNYAMPGSGYGIDFAYNGGLTVGGYGGNFAYSFSAIH